MGQTEESQEEIFDDIVANTNPVLAALPNREDLIMANLYIHPTLSFFSAKQNLLQITNTANYFGNRASECYSQIDDTDKIEYDIDCDKLSQRSDQNETQMMLDFLALRPTNG